MDKETLLLEQWRTASELDRHMDNVTWQRFNYFVATNGLLLTILGACVDAHARLETDAHAAASGHAFDIGTPLLRVIIVAIPIVGMLISWVWAVVQRRGQLYHCYRLAQTRQAEEALTIGGERVLTLFEKGLNDQKLDDHCLRKYKPYLEESWLGRLRTHNLIFWVAVFLAFVWIVLFLCTCSIIWSIWGAIVIVLILASPLVWLVWDNSVLLHMKRSVRD